MVGLINDLGAACSPMSALRTSMPSSESKSEGHINTMVMGDAWIGSECIRGFGPKGPCTKSYLE